MNDAADEPSKPTSAEPEYRKISDEELRRILENHAKWLAIKDRSDLDPLRANLTRADLCDRDLREAQLQGANLTGAQLRGANLTGAQLQGAILRLAQLEGANLAGAQLQGAILSKAHLQGADLRGKDLRKTHFVEAYLGKAQLQRANLAGAQLQGANLAGAQLQGADLRGAALGLITGLYNVASLPGAQLQGALLRRARLQGVDLSSVDLGKTRLRGVDLRKARLENADLRGKDLAGAQLQGANLAGAQLQGANLAGAQLQEAILSKAQLREADLRGKDLHNTDLKEADLGKAQLQGACLNEAQLQGACLNEAQLQGAYLNEAQLQGTYLNEAQLQGAYLVAAQLQGADLSGAHLREADLEGANFERLAINKDGKPGQDLPAATLTDADFRDAILTNAQLSTVAGLRAEMLAGAVLTNAKLPDDVARFDQLTHVAETSRNASTVFFGLLAASLYSWLTIATTTDVALITGTVSSPLPIINTNIALSGFYLAAPLILIAVYFYFHLYLQRLWGDLASLPALFPDGAALDRKAYPWLLNGLVRAHFHKLKLEERPLTRAENVVSILLAWWVVPFTLLAFWLRFLPRHDWWVTTLHVALIAGAAWFGLYSYRLAVRTLSGGATATEEEKRGDERLWARTWHTVRRYLPSGMEAATAGLAIVVVLSAGAAIDPRYDLLTTLGYETYADLTDDDVSTKPSGWTGQEETADAEIGQVKGADLEGRDLRNAVANLAFLARAKAAAANLSGADLIGANLTGATLRGANLSGANLTGANLSGANLSGANLSGATLMIANLTGADLTGVADLRGADLIGANLTGATLLANLGGADLRSANLTAALVPFAFYLTQAQLDVACGDDKTQLPRGLTIRTCPVTAPPGEPSPPPGSS